MTLDELLPRLESARPRGADKWSARCPAHPDKSPSLSIAEGERGLLLRCWAGCTVANICEALGISQRDLFYSSRPDPHALQLAHALRAQRQREHEVSGLTIDACREAERFIGSRCGLDILGWSNQHLEDELNALAWGYEILESEG